MGISIYLVLVLTLIIYIIGTLGYSVRIVGIKTGRIAVAFSVFNICVLIARTANAWQAPILSKKVEISIKLGTSANMLHIFRWILGTITIATIIGALLMPTFIKVFTRLVEAFSVHRSIPKLLIHGFSKSGIEQFKQSVTIPKKANFKQLKQFKKVPRKIICLNILTYSVSYVAVLSAFYAGCLCPSLRSTCSSLSPVINSIATISMFIFVDPYLSMMTDDVIKGKCTEFEFNRCITFIVGGLILGSILAQFLLVPFAHIIVFLAKVLPAF